MGLDPIVALTDHDDIEASVALQAMNHLAIFLCLSGRSRSGIFFHLGVHNIPANGARATMDRLKVFTENPRESELQADYSRSTR